jgi:hypothetical protein
MRKYSIWFLLALIVSACLEQPSDELDKKSFTRIYDNDGFEATYFPIDMRQTADGGYLMLGGRKLDNTNFTGIYLLKADAFGNFVSELEVEEDYVNPVAQLLPVADGFAFFCMDPLTLQTHLATVDQNLSDVLMTTLSSTVTYPAAASSNNNDLLLLSYDVENKQSVVSVVNIDGTVSLSKGYSIGAGDAVEEPLINHFLRTGKQFPFQVGRTSGGLYYFNGFYNYTFSLVFANLSQDAPSGVVQGQQDDGGFSAVLPLSASTFAASTFNFGTNVLLPAISLNTSGNTSAVDLAGNTLPELEANAPVRVIRATLNGKNVLVYGSNTRSKQIGLYFYDESTRELLGSRYLGYSYPYEISALIQTTEGDLAVCGVTYVAGRFPRFCLIKIAQADLKNI